MTVNPAIRAVCQLSLLVQLACSLPAQPTITILQKVNPAVPFLVWPTPLPIPFGTPLDGTELNASAAMPGTFSYDPDQGTLLPPGSNTLTVRFQPVSPNYTVSTASVALQVIAPGDSSFTLAALDTSGPTIVLRPGQSVLVHLTVAPIRDFHQPVTLSCPIPAPGVSCSFFPETVRPEFAPIAVDLTLSYSGVAHTALLSGPVLAAMLFCGILIVHPQHRLARSHRLARLLLLAFISLTLGATSGCIGNPSWGTARLLQIAARSLVESRTVELPYYIENNPPVVPNPNPFRPD